MAGLLLALLITLPARAAEYSLPDPPGAMTFDRITTRSVPAPKEKVPASCDAKFRAGLEKSFQSAWAQCTQIGKTESSDCQRALFDRCTQLAADLQKLEVQGCTAMLGESEALGAVQGVDTQKTAQASTAELNARAYVATQRVILKLKGAEASVAAHRATATGTLRSGACANSTESPKYASAEAVVTGAMDQAKAHLEATIAQKKSAAAQFSKNSGRSQANLDQLVSAAPVKSTITSRDTLSTSTSTSATTVTGTVVTTSSTTSAAITAGTLSPVILPAAPAPIYVAPADDSSSRTNWVPILAVGIPAAILTAVVVSKLSKNRPNTAQPDASNDTGGPAADPSGTVMPGAGDRNPTPSTVTGGGDLAQWKITTDPSFTDQQRSVIATAFSKIPECYRYKLQGLYVQNKPLPRKSGSCVAGMFIFGGNTVYLSPSCTVAIGVTVHEFFHVLGNRNGNELHQKWKPVSDKYPRCPVTTYGATNFYEDFAESGRLLIYPDSSAEAKNSGACVDSKIQGLGQILNACPAK